MLLVPKAVADLLGVEGQSHALHSPEALVLSQLGALLEHGLGHALASEAAAVDTMVKFWGNSKHLQSLVTLGSLVGCSKASCP